MVLRGNCFEQCPAQMKSVTDALRGGAQRCRCSPGLAQRYKKGPARSIAVTIFDVDVERANLVEPADWVRIWRRGLVARSPPGRRPKPRMGRLAAPAVGRSGDRREVRWNDLAVHQSSGIARSRSAALSGVMSRCGCASSS